MKGVVLGGSQCRETPWENERSRKYACVGKNSSVYDIIFVQ